MMSDNINNIKNKIEYIIDNDNSEVGDAFRGLKCFISYVLTSEEEDGFLFYIKDVVEESYQILKEEIEEYESNKM